MQEEHHVGRGQLRIAGIEHWPIHPIGVVERKNLANREARFERVHAGQRCFVAGVPHIALAIGDTADADRSNQAGVVAAIDAGEFERQLIVQVGPATAAEVAA